MNESEIEDKFSNQNNFYYGHGIGANNQDVIDSIFKYGLRCSHEQLDYTTISFGQGSDKLFTTYKEMMNNWPHQDSRQIIIASLPKDFHLLDIAGTPLYGKRHSAYYNSISQEQALGLGISPGLYLRPEFIVGLYDADKQDFVSNDQYYENLPKSEQMKLIHDVKIKYIDVLRTSGLSFTEYSHILKDCYLEDPLTDEEVQRLEFENKIITLNANTDYER